MNDHVNYKGFRHCVYGGQYGSEGKGCVAEFLIHRSRTRDRLIVFGENAPNSGHTNTKGKTRSMPVSAYFASLVILGPDSVIDPRLLIAELENIRQVNPNLEIIIHENAAFLRLEDIEKEKEAGLEGRVASTVTGGGAARTSKALYRAPHLVVGHLRNFVNAGIQIVDRFKYSEILQREEDADWLFECSQGLLLDLNLGIYPYVTSRTTHPRAAIERNGLGPSSHWRLTGTYRTYPIRTGGNSGPTGGRELQWSDLHLDSEVATVTRRIRRIFEFSGADFLYSLRLVEPDQVAFTHLDYLPKHQQSPGGFQFWLSQSVTGSPMGCELLPRLKSMKIIAGSSPGVFEYSGTMNEIGLAPWMALKPVDTLL